MKNELLKMLDIASKLCDDEKYIQALKYYESILQIESNNVVAKSTPSPSG